MDTNLVIGIVVGAVAVVVIALAIWILVARGQVRATDRAAAEAWATIGAQVRERGAVAARLVDAAASSAKPDQGSIEEARGALAAAGAASTPSDAAAAEQRVASALRAVASGVSGQDAVALHADVAKAEDAIQSARRHYNHSVREVQRKTRAFPGSLFAGGIERREFFEVDAANAVAEPPRVQF